MSFSICRVDENPYTGKVTYLEVQAAYSKGDLNIAAAFKSGFVGPNDELVLIGPDSEITPLHRPELTN